MFAILILFSEKRKTKDFVYGSYLVLLTRIKNAGIKMLRQHSFPHLLSIDNILSGRNDG